MAEPAAAGQAVRYLVTALLALAGAASSAAPGRAQEPDSLPPADPTPAEQDAAVSGRGNCVLTWESTSPDTRSLSESTGDDLYTTYIGGGMLWTCGNATMSADSAVKHDVDRRVELFGNVVYRDTIRTLESNYLTYFEIADRIVATDSVRLTRLDSGSTLEGPFVEFLRAVSGVDELTIARQRPHMTLYPQRDDSGPPFEVDADVATFAGEDEARAVGDVVVERPDLRAEADSARFRQPDGTGVLWGTPWIEAENIRLEGDTIRLAFEENTLRRILAESRGVALGEQFELGSDRIDVEVRDEEVEQVWGSGDGIAVAISGRRLVWGDSMHFVMRAGTLDTVVAVGDAAAIEEGRDGPAPSLERLRAGAGTLPPRDTLAGEPMADSAGVEAAPDPAADTAAVPVAVDLAAADSAAADSAVADSEVADSARLEEGESGAAGRQSPGRYRLPRLGISERGNWASGDTLWAFFRPSERSVPADTAGDAPRPDPVLDRLRVVGSARSYYAQVRDSTEVLQPSRNYMLGTAIEVVFEDGEPDRVIGTRAIGIFLEPGETFEGDAAVRPVDAATSPADSVGSPRDSAATADTSAVADMTGVRSNTSEVSRASRRDVEDGPQWMSTRAGRRSRGAR